MPTRDPAAPTPLRPRIALLPLLGPWHLRYPRYNAVSVRDIVAALDPALLLTSALEPGAFDDPGWQDTAELVLPHTVAPWAEARQVPLQAIGEPSPDPAAAADFGRYATQYSGLAAAWREVEAELAELPELLAQALTLERIREQLLPRLRAHQEARERAFGDGPASDWLRQRCGVVAERALAAARGADGSAALLAPVEQVPFLEDALADAAELLEPPQPAASAAERERALLDFAMRVEVPEPGNVLAQLRQLTTPEARYHEANLLLANGHAAEALELLETASRGDFSTPYLLPGYLLARLGQLYDLAGRRDAARRCYRGVRALSWAPSEALEAAAAGLERPFAPPDPDPDPESGTDATTGA